MYKFPRFKNGMVVAINLTNPVTISGDDFWGRKSSITFTPVEMNGWWRDIDANISGKNDYQKISSENIQSRKRRLCFCDVDGVWLNHPEHFTVLRVLGLDKVAIRCESKWPPYLLANEILARLSPFLHYAEYCLKWQDISTSANVVVGSDIDRYTSVYPTKDEIFIDATIDYHRVGKLQDCFLFNSAYDNLQLNSILPSKTQGWPRKLFWVEKFACKFLRWTHYQRVCWPQKETDVLHQFINHRMLDILGAIGAVSLSDDCLISCKIETKKGGHTSDIEALKLAIKTGPGDYYFRASI